VKVRIDNLQLFNSKVFGAECFLRVWPDLETVGIDVEKHSDGFFYVIDPKTGKKCHDCAFFTLSELNYLQVVK
jgi:hypothetical protein